MTVQLTYPATPCSPGEAYPFAALSVHPSFPRHMPHRFSSDGSNVLLRAMFRSISSNLVLILIVLVVAASRAVRSAEF